MGIERVKMILPLFLCVGTGKQCSIGADRSPSCFMCIVLHQFAELNDNHPFTQVQNCPKFGKNEMSIQRVEVILLSLPSLPVVSV